jgi:hypothetical protein
MLHDAILWYAIIIWLEGGLSQVTNTNTKWKQISPPYISKKKKIRNVFLNKFYNAYVKSDF